MLGVVPHFLSPTLFAVPEAPLFSRTADGLPAFCEFREAAAAFETVNGQRSLLKSVGGALVAVFFEFVATETGGEGTLGPDDCKLPSAVAVGAIRELAGFATPGFAAGLIRENWRDSPQRREAAMAVWTLAFEACIAVGMGDEAIRVRQNALYCVAMVANLRREVCGEFADAVVASVRNWL
jgi:hypothetical protein